ncbi:MAG: CPBP family intramembrane glutamic endopeptidase [Polyangiales bacterium]
MAVALLFAGIGNIFVIAALGQYFGWSVLVSLTLSGLMMLLLPLAAMRKLGLRGDALGLRRPPLVPVVAAVLIGCTAWLVNVRIVQLFPFEEGHLKTLNAVVDQPPLAVALLAIAVVPAVCEEVLFRGAVQRALATRLFPLAAVVVTAALFAGYHMSLIQLLPTFTLGILLGVLAHRADSVVPAMIAHLLNNTMAILVARRQPAVLADTLAAYPNAALVGCAIATIMGASLLVKGPA